MIDFLFNIVMFYLIVTTFFAIVTTRGNLKEFPQAFSKAARWPFRIFEVFMKKPPEEKEDDNITPPSDGADGPAGEE